MHCGFSARRRAVCISVATLMLVCLATFSIVFPYGAKFISSKKLHLHCIFYRGSALRLIKMYVFGNH